MTVEAMTYSFVILAAGKGERLGGTPKQFRDLGGRPVWRWSCETALTHMHSGRISEIALVLPQGFDADSLDIPESVVVLHGGKSRSLSVLEALKCCKCDCVLLHDAARPFVSNELIARLTEASNGDSAVIPLLPESNALKKICGGLMTAVDRDGMYITQTPQLFPRERLLRMLESAESFDFKDEAELWLQSGAPIKSVEGDARNFKITGESDWQMAQKLAPRGETRTGLGYDVHPLVPGRKFVLGGVEIPSPLGLKGHSDADALCHAIADAILSAAGLPDIGTLYPASDERFKDADSTRLLKDSLERVASKGWRVEWVSAVVTAQVPKLSPWKEAILRSLSCILGGDLVNVTFKSGEKIPPTGHSEALFVWASATLKR